MYSNTQSSPPGVPWPGWLFLAAALTGASLVLRLSDHHFGYDVALEDMPIPALVAGYCLVGGLTIVLLPRLVRSSGRSGAAVLALVVVAGLVMRLLQFGSEPVLEDDYNRYLWDGAVVAAGINPYSVAPQDVSVESGSDQALADLKSRAGTVFERINYPQYRTVYPPVAQAGFWLSYLVAPFNLDGWRVVLLVAELAILALIVAALLQLGQSPLWASVYWWNPIVIKETANSAHMEPLLVLPLMTAVVLVLRGRSLASSVMLTLAAGVKLWPMLLNAVVFRQLIRRPAMLITALLATAGILAVIAWPILAAGLSEDSGFVAYAQKWRASSAAYLVSEWLAGLAAPQFNHGMVARGLLAVALLATIIWLCRTEAPDQETPIQRLFWVSAAVYLLSPSQFPWYFLWVAPFLCLFPVRGLLLASALMPLHYLYFYFDARDIKHIYVNGIVWLMWLPVWAVLLYDAVRPQPRRAMVEA